MQSRLSTRTDVTPANRFRPLIEAAVAAGLDLSHQVLQLTRGDTARLRRDPVVRDDEICFSGGIMTFLGVRVVEGSPTSTLADANGVIVAPGPEQDDVSAMTKGRKKSDKDVRKPKAAKPKPAAAV